MSLLIVEKACSVTPDRSRGVIVVESDNVGPPFTEAFHELDGQDARSLAQGYAAQLGVAPAFINGNVIGPYPVNKEGMSLEHVRDGDGHPLPANHERMQPARYRIDVPVNRPLR